MSTVEDATPSLLAQQAQQRQLNAAFAPLVGSVLLTGMAAGVAEPMPMEALPMDRLEPTSQENMVGVSGAVPNAGADAAGSSGGVPPQLLSGQAAEAGQLEALNSSGKVLFTPTPEQANSAAFQLIVGDPQYTASGDLVGTIYDGQNADGLIELKNGSSMLNSSYQLRLETYGSLVNGENGTPFSIYTSRPVNPTFQQYLTNWGVSVQPLP